MTDKAALLRAYHAALHRVRSTADGALTRADQYFWRAIRVGSEEMNTLLPARDTIFAAHRDRVNGQGSPAACDEALARALREIGT
jgi:hypothetical protein